MIPDSEIARSLRVGTWTTIQKNYCVYEYYTGIDDGNPSGEPNLKQITYYDGNSVVKFRQVFSWNVDDRLIKEECV